VVVRAEAHTALAAPLAEKPVALAEAHIVAALVAAGQLAELGGVRLAERSVRRPQAVW
jgi:hypothetical protein